MPGNGQAHLDGGLIFDQQAETRAAVILADVLSAHRITGSTCGENACFGERAD